jgi:hypothetical protein
MRGEPQVSRTPLMACLWALAALLAWPAGAQPSGAPLPLPPVRVPDVYLLEFSSVPIERHAAAIETITRLADRTVLWMFDEAVPGDRVRAPGVTGFALRLGKWMVLDAPVAAYADILGHESGHYARLREFGHPAQLVIAGSPWTLRLAQVRSEGLEDPSELPAIYAAGFESTVVMRERIERRIAQRGHASSMDLTLVLTGLAQTIGYVVTDLQPGRLDRFPPVDPGDARGYVATLLAQAPGDVTRAEYETLAGRVRRRAWLNLADTGLLTVGAGLFRDYLWRGQRDMPLRWMRLGPVEVMPRIRYHLSPVGPEHQVRSLFRAGGASGHAYVRWTDPVHGGRLVGAGLEQSAAARGRWQPTFRLDFWRNPDAGPSGRAEVSTLVASRRQGRLLLVLTAGAKGRGYVVGQALGAGGYGGIGAGLRF